MTATQVAIDYMTQFKQDRSAGVAALQDMTDNVSLRLQNRLRKGVFLAKCHDISVHIPARHQMKSRLLFCSK